MHLQCSTGTPCGSCLKNGRGLHELKCQRESPFIGKSIHPCKSNVVNVNLSNILCRFRAFICEAVFDFQCPGSSAGCSVVKSMLCDYRRHRETFSHAQASCLFKIPRQLQRRGSGCDSKNQDNEQTNHSTRDRKPNSSDT